MDASQRVLYRWRSVPTKKNIGGAVERPTARYVYDKVVKARGSSDKTEDASLDNQPELDSEGRPWLVFISLLMANGWFIKPKPFLLTNSSTPIAQRAKNARLRIPIFVAAWLLAAMMLPGTWVGLAAVAYGLWITPHIRLINQQFQNIEEPDS